MLHIIFYYFYILLFFIIFIFLYLIFKSGTHLSLNLYVPCSPSTLEITIHDFCDQNNIPIYIMFVHIIYFVNRALYYDVVPIKFLYVFNI